MMIKRKDLTIILNITEACNFSCKYCFEGQFCDKNVKSIKEINKIFLEALPKIKNLIMQVVKWNDSKEIRILLHGGEPLLITAENYSIFFKCIENMGVSPYYMLQSNGSLFTEEHVKLFKTYDVRVGISIDGFKELHDSQRINKAGNGTFETVMMGIEIMRAGGLKPGAMATITSQTIKYPKEFYDFFAINKFDLRFNPIFAGIIPADDNSIYITPNEYADFACKVFDFWVNDQEHDTNLLNYSTVVNAFFTEDSFIPTCTFNKNCFDGFVAMDMIGDLYHCHRTVGDKKLCSGNIDNMTIEDFIDDGKHMEVRWDILKEEDCKNCSNSNYCYGGCPYNSYLYKNSFYEKDYFCTAYRKINHYVYNYMKKYE